MTKIAKCHAKISGFTKVSLFSTEIDVCICAELQRSGHKIPLHRELFVIYQTEKTLKHFSVITFIFHITSWQDKAPCCRKKLQQGDFISVLGYGWCFIQLFLLEENQL